MSKATAGALLEPMSTKVKICGIKTESALEAALVGGADYVGFVFYAPSPRSVALETAGLLAAQARGRASIVTLVVDPGDDLLDEIIGRVAPDLIQLHGSETPERVASVRRRHARPVMKAIKVATAADAAGALAYRDVADLVLFDAKSPDDMVAALPGGNGLPFDWEALAQVRDKVPYMLSGGLTPENVAAAVRLTGAGRVDVSSGVERAPGEKDPGLIRQFLAAAKTAG